MLGGPLPHPRQLVRLVSVRRPSRTARRGQVDGGLAAGDAWRPGLVARPAGLARSCPGGPGQGDRRLPPHLRLRALLRDVSCRAQPDREAVPGRHRRARRDRLRAQLHQPLHALGRSRRHLLPRLDVERRRLLGLHRRPHPDHGLRRKSDPFRRRPAEAPAHDRGRASAQGPQRPPNQSLRRKRQIESVPWTSTRGTR
jgi:hypothetical protein